MKMAEIAQRGDIDNISCEWLLMSARPVSGVKPLFSLIIIDGEIDAGYRGIVSQGFYGLCSSCLNVFKDKAIGSG